MEDGKSKGPGCGDGHLLMKRSMMNIKCPLCDCLQGVEDEIIDLREVLKAVMSRSPKRVTRDLIDLCLRMEENRDKLRAAMMVLQNANEQLSCEKARLYEMLEAVHPVLYGLLLEKWGNPQNWRTNTVGYQVFHQLLCALGLCEHGDCQHCAALPSDIDSGMSE